MDNQKIETAPWFGLLFLYGASSNYLPLYQYLCQHCEVLAVGNTEDRSFSTYEVPEEHSVLTTQLEQTFRVRPYSYLLGGRTPHEMNIVTRNATVLTWLQGQVLHEDGVALPSRLLSKLNQHGEEDANKYERKNYTELVRERVVSHMPGKWSMSLAYIGIKTAFVLSCRNVQIHLWLIYFDGAYFLFWSTNKNAAHELEMAFGKVGLVNREIFFQQEIELELSSILTIHPIYFVNKVNKRMHTYVDRNSRKMLICNFIRTYLTRQNRSID